MRGDSYEIVGGDSMGAELRYPLLLSAYLRGTGSPFGGRWGIVRQALALLIRIATLSAAEL
jgi:hypothetical protein